MKVTDNAIKQLQQELNQLDTPGSGIRIFTTSGCCGPSLQMNVSKLANSNDQIIVIDEVNFFIDPEAVILITSLTIDFINGRFKFDKGIKSTGCCG